MPVDELVAGRDGFSFRILRQPVAEAVVGRERECDVAALVLEVRLKPVDFTNRERLGGERERPWQRRAPSASLPLSC